jgi:hypothetical protein
MKKVAYHCWSLKGEPEPFANLRTPVVASISTLRGVSDVPIVVLDASDHDVNWGHFPEKLNFEVVKIKLKLQKYKSLVEGYNILSRIFDLNEYFKNENHDVIYCDTDTFFFRDPFPLFCKTDRFCWNYWNAGFFYFNPSSDVYKEFFDVYDSYTRAAIHSEEIRKIIKKHIHYEAWYGVWEEMILKYMERDHINLFNEIPIEEHTTSQTLHRANFDSVKVFHANGSIMEHPLSGERHSRGLIGIMMQEFYQNMIKVLDEEDLKLMYGEQALSFFKKMRVTFLEKCNNLGWTKNQGGLYELIKLTKKVNFI